MRFWGKGTAASARPSRVMLAGLLALGVTAVVALLAATPVVARADWWVEVATDELNLRSEPGAWGEIVGQVWGGEWVDVLDGPSDGNWYWVQSGDRAGWADGSYLALDGAPAWDGVTATTATWEGAGGPAAWGERWVSVDRSDQLVTLYEGETPVATYWGAMGSDGSADGFFATAVGTHYVYDKTEGLNWTDYGGGFITHWAGFDPNRANGFHSYLKDENGWPVPGGDGPTGGCVALEPGAAEHLYWFVSIGTRVEVHW